MLHADVENGIKHLVESKTHQQTVKDRRLQLAGHCVRHEDEIAHHLVLWEPTRGTRNKGRRGITFIDNLKEDTSVWSALEN